MRFNKNPLRQARNPNSQLPISEDKVRDIVKNLGIYQPSQELEATIRVVAVATEDMANTDYVDSAIEIVNESIDDTNSRVEELGQDVSSNTESINILNAQVGDLAVAVEQAPGTLSDLDHGAPISVTGDQFPDVLSIDNSLGPVIALNESIADLAQRDEWLKAQIEDVKGASGASLIGYTAPQGVERPTSNKLGDIINALDYGVVTNSTEDQSVAIQKAIDKTPLNGVLQFPPGVFYAKGLVVSKPITLQGNSYGKYGPLSGYAPAGPYASTLVLHSTGDYLIKVGSNSGSILEGFCARDMVFSGRQMVVGDAVLVMENTTSPLFESCHFSYSNGRAIRMQSVWETLFDHCFFRSNDASNVDGMIKLDSILGGDVDKNVNNLRFLNSCHFENNLGVYIFGAADANVDILQISGNKFEWGRGSIPAAGPWPVFKLLQCARLDISHNSFTNFRVSNKYDTILEAGDATAGTNTFGQMEHNAFANFVGATYIARIRGTSSLRIRSNINASANEPGLYDCTSRNAQQLEYLDSAYNAYGPNQAAAGKNIPAGFISSHEVAFNLNDFTVDAASLSIAKTAQSSAVPGRILLNLNPNRLTGSPTGWRIGIRVRSATGVGTIDVITPAGTTTFTPSTTYQTISVTLTAAQMAVLPGVAVRVQAGSTTSEAVTVDGVYVIPLGTNVPGMIDAFFQGTIADGATQTISVPNVNNPNRRGTYMVTADTNGAGYALFHSSGSALTSISTGGDFAVATSDPATPSKINVYLSGNNISIRNSFGSSRVVAVFPMMAH